MGKMFVSLENSTNDTTQSVFEDSEPMQSKAATASYRCKLYRALLEQGAASQFIISPLSVAKSSLQPRA